VGRCSQPLVEKKINDIKDKGLPADDYEKYLNERIAYWAEQAPSESECVQWVTDNVKQP
jgi:hypothetical protein